MPSSLFQGLKVSIDINNYSEKQRITKLVKDNGGDVSSILNKKSFVLVATPSRDKNVSYKVSSGLKLGVPVVSIDYTKTYLIATSDHRKEEAAPSFLTVEEPPKKEPIIKHPYKAEHTPYFPPEFEILKTDILQKDTKFCGLELHVGGLGISEVLGSVQSDRKHERSYFRVFLHHGNTKAMSSSTMECVYSSSLASTEDIYTTLYIEYESTGYHKVHLTSTTIGSEKARGTSAISGIASQISPKVKDLVSTLYKEATARLCGILQAPGGVSLAPEGKINSPLGQLSLDQVEKAESILLQINEFMKKPQPWDPQVEILTAEFFKILPDKQGIITDIEQKLEDIQLMKDLLTVGEGLGTQKGLSEEEIRYKALRCEIKYLSFSSDEYKTIAHTINKSLGNSKLDIINIFEIKRQVERESFTTNIPNQQMLFHGSNASYVMGILSRGLLLPKSPIAGVTRTDKGMLGSGIYFANDASTSAKYSKPYVTGSQFLLASMVALGSVKRYFTVQTQLESPPHGFDSVQGVKTGAKTTEFLDDEFVIYNANQCYMSYLIEFKEISATPLAPPVQGQFVGQNLIQIEPTSTKEDIAQDTIPDTPPPPLSQQAPVEPSGLMAQGKLVPLRAVHVSARLLDMVGEVTVLQHYCNSSTSPVEAKFVFPLDEMAAVCAFEAFVNGKHIVGHVEEKARAHKAYAEAVAQGHGAYLLDEEKPDIFTVSVGNLPPQSDVIIKMKYITELLVDGDDISFIIPATVAPAQSEQALRELTQSVTKTVAATDNAHGFSLQIGVEMPFDILRLDSPTHPIFTKRTHSKATVCLAGSPLKHLDKSFILLIGVEEAHTPRMWVEIDDKGHHASMLSFNPRFESNSTQETDLLIMVDRSCSMEGEALQDLRRILRALISNLPTVTAPIKFNIFDFGSTFTRLFESNVPVNPAALQKAWQHINSIKANFGGTDIHMPMKALYLRAFLSRRPTNIFLFTDGHAAQPDHLLDLIRCNSKRARLFTFGIGPNPSRHYIRAMARAGSGYAEFVTPNKIPNPRKVVKQLSRAVQPAFSSVSVKFDNSGLLVQAPAKISSIFSGERQLVYAFAGACTHATLVALSPEGGAVSSSVHTHEAAFVKGSSLIHRLAARAMIRDYEDGTLSDIPHMDEALKRKLKDSIIEMSIKHSIISQYTSFVAIEERKAGEVISVKTPALSELIAKESVDEFPSNDMEWMEIEEMKREEEKQQELREQREKLVSSAKASTNYNKYTETVQTMTKVAKLHTYITVEERSLLGEAVLEIIAAECALFKAEKERMQKKNVTTDTLKLKKHKKTTIQEATKFIDLIEKDIEPYNTTGENKVYFEFAKARCYNCLNKVEASQGYANKARELYEAAYALSKKELPPTHPIRLTGSMHLSYFYYAQNQPEKACQLAKEAFDNSIAELDCLSEDSYKDSTLIMQLLRDSLTQWTAEMPQEEDEDQKRQEIPEELPCEEVEEKPKKLVVATERAKDSGTGKAKDSTVAPPRTSGATLTRSRSSPPRAAMLMEELVNFSHSDLPPPPPPIRLPYNAPDLPPPPPPIPQPYNAPVITAPVPATVRLHSTSVESEVNKPAQLKLQSQVSKSFSRYSINEVAADIHLELPASANVRAGETLPIFKSAMSDSKRSNVSSSPQTLVCLNGIASPPTPPPLPPRPSPSPPMNGGPPPRGPPPPPVTPPRAVTQPPRLPTVAGPSPAKSAALGLVKQAPLSSRAGSAPSPASPAKSSPTSSVSRFDMLAAIRNPIQGSLARVSRVAEPVKDSRSVEIAEQFFGCGSSGFSEALASSLSARRSSVTVEEVADDDDNWDDDITYAPKVSQSKTEEKMLTKIPLPRLEKETARNLFSARVSVATPKLPTVEKVVIPAIKPTEPLPEKKLAKNLFEDDALSAASKKKASSVFADDDGADLFADKTLYIEESKKFEHAHARAANVSVVKVEEKNVVVQKPEVLQLATKTEAPLANILFVEAEIAPKIDKVASLEIEEIFQPTEAEATDRILPLLRTSLLLHRLSPSEHKRLLAAMSVQVVRAGETVIRAGDSKADYFYLVEKGELDVWGKRNGRDETLAVLKAGDSFGEVALWYSSPRNATVRAKMQSVLWRVDGNTFVELTGYKKHQFEPWVKVLQKVAVLEPLLPYELTLVAYASSVLRLNVGDVVVNEGALSDNFYVVLSGSLTASGGSKKKSYLKHDSIGLDSVAHDQPEQATIKASAFSEVLVLKRAYFHKFVLPHIRDLL